MNFITIRENITHQQAKKLLNEFDKMAQTQEIGAFCGHRILYIDCVAGKVKYSFVNRKVTGHKNEKEITRNEVIQFMLNQ